MVSFMVRTYVVLTIPHQDNRIVELAPKNEFKVQPDTLPGQELQVNVGSARDEYPIPVATQVVDSNSSSNVDLPKDHIELSLIQSDPLILALPSESKNENNVQLYLPTESKPMIETTTSLPPVIEPAVGNTDVIVEIRIPASIPKNRIISVTVNGKLNKVQVPANARAGQTLKFSVASAGTAI